MKSEKIVFINAIRPATFEAFKLFEKETGRILEPVVLVDTAIKQAITARNGQTNHLNQTKFIEVDFDSPESIRRSLDHIDSEIHAVVCQYENSVLELKKLLPYIPYLPGPTESSLIWATEKKLMRDLMHAYDTNLVPFYAELHELDSHEVEKIESKVSYPLIIKPSGLEGSLLVSKVTNHDELLSGLTRGFIDIQNAYDTWIKRQKPFFLIEEFMDGDMYSIDAYINAGGNAVFTPIVEVVTGKKVGYDDFFGYVRKAPVILPDENAAQEAALKACKALGLRSITAHVELMRLGENKWKIIELGPRIGGYRHDIYGLSFGINHIVNDIINRAGENPVVPIEPLGYSAMFNIYARNEGTITSITGLQTIEGLDSLVRLNQLLYVNDEALFAKHNGDPVFEVLLFNKDKNQFEKDCNTVQNGLMINVSSEK